MSLVAFLRFAAPPRLGTLLPTALLVLSQSASAQGTRRSYGVEGDASAYLLGGYSIAVRVTSANGLTATIGGGSYSLPSFVLESQDTYDIAKWKARSEAIQVARIGYRFAGARQNGPELDAVLLHQRWRVDATALNQRTRFNTVSGGFAVGYLLHIGRRLLLYPHATVIRESPYGQGRRNVAGVPYEVRSLNYNATIHVGVEW